MGVQIKYLWELDVYNMAFKAAVEIFELTKQFPKEERYSLTDQIRRSSRSVTGNISEAWHKRRYEAAFPQAPHLLLTLSQFRRHFDFKKLLRLIE
jgi:hypothetical protein